MYHFKHHHIHKAVSIPLFFTILGLAISPLFVPRVGGQDFQGESSISTPIIAISDLVATVVIVIPKDVKKIAEAHLKIPSLKIDAVIKDMGLTPSGAMAVPGNNIDVGWFSLGTRPGETGSAVIGGHNRWAYESAVFDHLDQLKKGDFLFVVDAEGVSTSFVVRDMQTYDATDINTGIFESESGIHLNLITCSGAWDPSTQSHAKRLVIFTDAI